METNYYLRTKICMCCGRYEELHIGVLRENCAFVFISHDDIKSSEDWEQAFGGEI